MDGPDQIQGGTMEIDKSQILDYLTSLGKNDEASKADKELPDKVDTDKDSGLLSRFGVDPKELLGKLGGNLGGMFGG
jgi:hypothetical protein